MSAPLFSILHSTARPDGWQAAFDEWLVKSVHPENVEYVLCVDERWGFAPRNIDRRSWSLRTIDQLVWNEGPKTAVSGWNTAAAASTGSILLVVADDFSPCERWDEALQAAVADGIRMRFSDGLHDDDFAIRVSMGVPEADKQGHMCHAFLSRARYEHQGGNVYHPEYEGVFCDNDFTAHSEQDGVIIEARHLVFPHRNPFYKHGPGGCDAAWWHHNKPRDYAFGQAIFQKRLASHFGHDAARVPVASPETTISAAIAAPGAAAGQTETLKNETLSSDRGGVPDASGAPSRILCFCLPGERFESDWVAGLVPLLFHAAGLGFRIQVHFAYTSNVYVTRAELLETVMASDPRPDLVLWLDDDNILAPDQLDTLLLDLEARPDADGVTGWCWIQFEKDRRFVPSCGDWMPDGVHLKPLAGIEFEAATELRQVEWTGFPAFLMRISAIEKAGANPFLPVLDERLRYGIAGEDASFCRAAGNGGAVFLVDPRVRVPHIKPRAIEPDWQIARGGDSQTSQSDKEPVTVGMIRAKNEARWIERAVKSLLTVCARVLVMDDGSTDETIAIAGHAGAEVFISPFAVRGGDPDEARDKSWLLAKVHASGPVDWVLCIDGDEELAPGAAEAIKAAVKRPGAACYALPFWHLWDRLDQIRVDRWYSTFTRRSLFRPLPGFSFRSLYAGANVQAHCGLHTSNGPANLPIEVLPGARLIHYGYMNREDRIRKFNWYNRVDPGNELEDGYRHCIQGDIPSVVPADAVLKHAGPLKLAPLPVELPVYNSQAEAVMK